MVNSLILLLQDATNGPKDVKGEVDVNTDSIFQRLDSWLDGFIRNLPNILIGIVIIVAMFFIARWLGRFVKKQLKKNNRPNFGEILGGFLKWLLIIAGVGFAFTIMAPSISFGDLIGGLGVSSVAIGFAFQDILQNWLAGILILSRQPFRVGDEIEVNGFLGRVDRIETRATIITTYDGIDIVIPNNDIYTNAVKVKTAHEFIRSQYDLGLGYDQPYEKAIKTLRETLEGIEGIIQDKPIDLLNWDQADSWLTIRMRWWTKSDRGSVVKTFSEVIAKTQHAMDKEGIDLPFPTQVEVRNARDVQESQDREDTDYKSKKSKNQHEDSEDSDSDSHNDKNENTSNEEDTATKSDNVENKDKDKIPPYEKKLKKRNDVDGNAEV